MTPIVKLVFGVDYDKARLTEFAAALSYAQRQDVHLGEFKSFIENQAGGLKAPVERELRNEIWLKLLGNATFNPVSAITGATVGELGANEAMREMLRQAFREIAQVAERINVTFPVSLDRRLEAGFAVGDHKTSMLQDLEAGRPLELEPVVGAVSPRTRGTQSGQPPTRAAEF